MSKKGVEINDDDLKTAFGGGTFNFKREMSKKYANSDTYPEKNENMKKKVITFNKDNAQQFNKLSIKSDPPLRRVNK